jgi:hypothetical protein
LPSIRELGHTHEHQHVTDPSRAMDAASSWTHSASTHRSSICAGPGTTPPRHRPDSTIPRVCTTAPTIPSRYSAQSPTKAAKRPSNLCHPPTARRTPLPAFSVAPRAHLAKCEPARWPPRPTAAPDGTAATRRYPPLHKPSTAQAEAGRPTRPTRHYPLHELEEATDDYPGDHNL